MDVDKIRDDFPILNSKVYGKPLVYLDNAATTQKPRCVIEKVRDFYYHSNSNIHRGVYYLSEIATEGYEEARVKVQKFINANTANEIVFTSGTTGAINLLADSFGRAFITKGDEIIITEMEHHSNIEPWRVLCKRNEASLKVIPFEDSGKLMIEKIPAMINERTKLIAVCHVSNVLGVINPVKRITQIAHREGIPVLIDGAQSAPHISVDVQDVDCDFFTFSGHKMYAETGIGVLYGKEKYLEKMPPYQTGGGMIQSMDNFKTTYEDLPLKFEAGTPNYVGAISLANAIDYMQSIGIANIFNHELDVINYALEKLKREEHLIIYGKISPHCGSVSFNIAGIHPQDVTSILDKFGIAVRSGYLCAQPTIDHFKIKSLIRLSVGIYNTRKEIDLFIEGVNKAKSLLL
ncbi:MAG: SufS family cysteine desulfurase [Candidatus Cloacimonetes bacterium]|nr:SufS family cysteine desulfurase [Candidatus Cloacimonadota bacterium]